MYFSFYFSFPVFMAVNIAVVAMRITKAASVNRPILPQIERMAHICNLQVILFLLVLSFFSLVGGSGDLSELDIGSLKSSLSQYLHTFEIGTIHERGLRSEAGDDWRRVVIDLGSRFVY